MTGRKRSRPPGLPQAASRKPQAAERFDDAVEGSTSPLFARLLDEVVRGD
ncbi:MAG TPA: hypothetical protein VFQ44_21890 [Streptosporangiaceae bacterium]|nr:hypothetical protein [Streptosporangiaceae bacterium]